ncbi:MAG: hypothetical protein AAB654_09655 [Acidobacteriota bacterium]
MTAYAYNLSRPSPTDQELTSSRRPWLGIRQWVGVTPVGNALVTEAEFTAWAAGDAAAFEVCREKLCLGDGGLAERLLVRQVGSTRVLLGNPDYARAAAIEDLDCKVSGGALMVGPEGPGRETARALSPREFVRAGWRGPREFHALFRAILRRHCARAVSDRLWFTAEGSAGERSADEDEPTTRLAVQSPEEGVINRTDLPEHIQQHIRELSVLAEVLRGNGQSAVADLVEAIIDTLEAVAGGAQELLEDPRAFREAVRERLGLSPNAFYQRWHRYLGVLTELREFLSPWLVLRARRQLVQEAEDADADCAQQRGRLMEAHAATLGAVHDFLRWTIAEQNPHYQGCGLERIRSARVWELTGGRREVLLRIWPPDGGGFSPFCHRFALLDGDAEQAVSDLVAVLQELDHPPKRLIGTLKSVFPALLPERR